MNVRFLGAHNTESRDTRMVSLLVDGVLALDAGGLTSALSFEEQLRLKAVLLTHGHYDHVRDIPALAMNMWLRQASIDVYSIQPVREALDEHLINGGLYNRFLEFENGPIRFHVIEPFTGFQIGSYRVLPLPVKHAIDCVGYVVESPDGASVLYTGDTGPGLAGLWRHASPRLVIAEVTAPDRMSEFAREKGHLTPSLLGEELENLQKTTGCLPRVATVHMNPALETEIRVELAAVARRLGASIIPAGEGMELAV